MRRHHKGTARGESAWDEDVCRGCDIVEARPSLPFVRKPTLSITQFPPAPALDSRPCCSAVNSTGQQTLFIKVLSL